MSSFLDLIKDVEQQGPKEPIMNLKKQLQFLLDHRGMTAAELSRKSKVSKQVISLWLSGVKPKNIDQVKMVADGLGSTVDHLVFGNGLDTHKEQVTELNALIGNDWVSGQFEIKIRRIKKDRKQP